MILRGRIGIGAQMIGLAQGALDKLLKPLIAAKKSSDAAAKAAATAQKKLADKETGRKTLKSEWAGWTYNLYFNAGAFGEHRRLRLA